MKIFTVYPKDLDAREWVVAQVRYTLDGYKLVTVSQHATFAEACKAERALRKEAFSLVLPKKK